jgi:hypothetical protein
VGQQSLAGRDGQITGQLIIGGTRLIGDIGLIGDIQRNSRRSMA